METLGSKTINSGETARTHRIEHLPKFDVVVNLDYPNKKDQEEILNILGEKINDNDWLGPSKLAGKVSTLNDKNGNKRFFLKNKHGSVEHIDYILGRSTYDPINPEARSDFDKRSRYVLVGVLNEILLSKKIKEILNSNKGQELAKKHGFSGITFSEPILAAVEKDKKNSHKFLIYEFIKQNILDFKLILKMKDLSEDLRELFKQNGVVPHDLRWDQLMVVGAGEKPGVVLTDIEAYTETDKSNKEK